MNKKTLAIVHRWFGLTLGLLLVLQALAGTVLHFRDDLVRLSVGADRPACTIAHLLARVPPDRHVQRIAFDGGGCPALVRLQAPDHLEFHVPVRGAAAGGIDLIESPVAGGLHWVFAFHHNMLMGTAGRWLAATAWRPANGEWGRGSQDLAARRRCRFVCLPAARRARASPRSLRSDPMAWASRSRR